MKYIVLICLCVILLLACNNQQTDNKNTFATTDSTTYLKLHFPEFKSIKLLFLDKTIYDKPSNLKEFDSLVAKKVLRGSFDFFTFLDSVGNPLSKHYDSLVLKKEEQEELIKLLSNYDAKDDGFSKCGAQYRHAIVFYDSATKPVGFVEIAFECDAFQFSKAFQFDLEKCNKHAMMKKFKFFFNKTISSHKELGN